jgi:hypothetical protein
MYPVSPTSSLSKGIFDLHVDLGLSAHNTKMDPNRKSYGHQTFSGLFIRKHGWGEKPLLCVAVTIRACGHAAARQARHRNYNRRIPDPARRPAYCVLSNVPS